MELFLTANLAPIMFGALVIFLLSGFPVAFSLAANGLFFGFVGIELGLLKPELLQALPNRIFGIMANDTLLAIPFFTFMGLILERSGMAEDLLDTIGQLFGPIRGGVAYAVIFVGALLAATTGVVAASVISMGLISLPVMLRYGYDKKLASGVIAASGTLAQIIPPSLVLIVMADQLGRSVGDMYKAAFIPGLMLTAMYAGYVLALSIFKPHHVPALPLEARNLRQPNGNSGAVSLLFLVVGTVAASFAFAEFYRAGHPNMAKDELGIFAAAVGIVGAFAFALANRHLKLNLLSRMAEKVVFVMIPPLALIFLVLGTIFIGLATPTEGGGMGAMGAILLAMANRRLSWSLMKQAMNSTTRLSCFVIFILIGSTVFSLVFRGVNGDLWVEHLLSNLPGGTTGFLIVVNIMFFGLAFFLDFFELAFILVPLVGPVAEKLGIDLIWFGVLLGVNMQTSFMHPPFGFALFYLRSVAPKEVKTSDIYWGAIPFVCIQVVMVALIIAFPHLVSVEKKTDMTEQIELKIDAPADYGTPAPADEPKKSDDEAPALNFSTDTDKK
ncbi:TRAP-type mannitol/chloroaromatic compound transport system permease large subunit [Janthinobacterium sp. CG_23.3]|uniref:TRAP transporter large permease n=1 Tax=unclassified Janthinobacterium TaxID=2610881 RepID=UPI000345664A|nr:MULTISPECIES: TRAP transporter large permease subunit [unclassified Janthinobacterium]MEC5161764.1 TRAP-type mannitol/chloroaromatic compound transport system permease large subunit [Janthinobacterium sp. CG_S6]